MEGHWRCGLPVHWLAQVMAQDAQTRAHGMVPPANIPGICRSGAHRIPLCPEHSQVAPLHLLACKGWVLGWEERRYNFLPQAPCSLKPPYAHWALHWAGREGEDGNIPLSPSVTTSYSTLVADQPWDSAESL